MVMGRRPGVQRSSWPVAVTDLIGLVGEMGLGMARVPFRRPWSGQGNLAHNVAVSVTRETMRTFMGYSTSLPVDEFRSIELVLDDLCGVVLPPIVSFRGADHEDGAVGGVLGEWIRPRNGRSGGTILYLHGGGYVGTSPRMYSVFAAWLARRTGCDVFVPDLRLAPEFPFPADLEDTAAALHVPEVAVEKIDIGVGVGKNEPGFFRGAFGIGGPTSDQAGARFLLGAAPQNPPLFLIDRDGIRKVPLRHHGGGAAILLLVLARDLGQRGRSILVFQSSEHTAAFDA